MTMQSNRDPDARYESLPQSVPWYVGEALKHQVRTAMPGVVVEYDPGHHAGKNSAGYGHNVGGWKFPNSRHHS